MKNNLYLCIKISKLMKIVNFAKQNTVINQYVAELRDVNIQKDRARFRRNLGRIGQLIAYEVSKTLRYSEKTVQTPLALAKVSTMEDEVVLATIFRAGLPFHQGFLEVFDHADNGFVSAYRYYRDKECKTVDVKVEYIASPDLTNKVLIIADPMLATGGSFELGYHAFITNGIPASVHLCCAIASQKGVDNMKKVFGGYDNVTLWCAAIDPGLDEHCYIVPGLGDCGDLAYGEKL
jgi:uracil phosphoribosyltransferase